MTLRFSGFTVDVHRHALTRDGRPVDLSKRLVGVVSLGDLSGGARTATTGEALKEISKPGTH